MRTNVTLKQLEVFLTVVKEASFTHAGKVLNMTQPAVSSQIKNLEQRLDIKLFEYVDKKLTLTEIGHSIIKQIHDVQDKVEGLKDLVSNLKGILAGQLNISIPPGAQKQAFYIVKGFYDQHPHISIDIKVSNRMEQLKLLQENSIDFCIMGTPPKKTSLYADALFSYRSIIIAPTTHPLTKHQNITLEKIRHETLICGEHYSHSRKILKDLLIDDKTTLIYVNNGDSVKYAVEAGLGIAVVPENILNPDLKNKYYAVLDVQGFPIQSHVYLVHRHNKLLSPVGTAFKNFALAYCKEHY